MKDTIIDIYQVINKGSEVPYGLFFSRSFSLNIYCRNAKGKRRDKTTN